MTQLRELPLDRIESDPDQPRKEFDEAGLAELAKSMRDQGLLQPITVRPVEGDRYMVIAGDRRFRAAQRLGWPKIPALVVVFKNHGFERELLPPGYPFLAESDLEMATMLRWIFDHHAEATKDAPQWKSWIRANVDRVLGFNRLLDQVSEVVLEDVQAVRSMYRWSADTIESSRKVLEAGATTWPPFVLGLRRLKPNLLRNTAIRSSRNFPVLAVYRYFMPPGWEDTCEGTMPTFQSVNVKEEGE